MTAQPVSESNIEAIRAFFHLDSDALERAMARMQADGTVETYPRVLAAAMVMLLQRRLGSAPTLADIVSLVARLRADQHTTDELDINPTTAEKLIRADYGDVDVIADVDQQELADVQGFLVSALAEDEALDEQAREALIADVRQQADAVH